MIASHPSLTSFDFSQNFFGEECGVALAQALTTNRSLTSLYLHACGLTTKVVQALSAALSAPDCALSTLQLSSNGLGRAAVSGVAQALRRNTSVTSLNLSLNPIEDAGSRALAEALCVNSTLTDLKLDDVGPITAAALLPWAQTLTANRALRSLTLDLLVDCTPALSAALAQNQTLRELALIHQYFHHSSEPSPVCACGDVLLAALTSNQSLRVLRAPQCSCTPAAAAASAAAPAPTAAAAAAASGLAKALSANRHLSALTLKQNPSDEVLNVIDRNAVCYRTALC
jgi:hypothetical protein